MFVHVRDPLWSLAKRAVKLCKSAVRLCKLALAGTGRVAWDCKTMGCLLPSLELSQSTLFTTEM